MICSRSIELHTPELYNLGHHQARLFELGVGHVEIHLAVVRPTVIGRDHPAETKVFRHQRVHLDRIDGVAAEDGRRRLLLAVPTGAIAAVDMVIAGDPARRCFLSVTGRGVTAKKSA